MRRAFEDELQKIAAGRDVGQLLSSLAQRKGLDPTKIPAIKQVGNVAGHNRGRAAEIAGNVRSFLKSAPSAG